MSYAAQKTMELQTGFEPACADLEDRCLSARATGAWRPEPELNRRRRFCRVLPDHSGIWSIWQPPLGIEPRTFAFRERRSTAELRGINGQGERIRTSGLRIPSAELYQAELHPDELERATGLEPACLPVRSRTFIHLNYARICLERPTGFEPAFPSLRG